MQIERLEVLPLIARITPSILKNLLRSGLFMLAWQVKAAVCSFPEKISSNEHIFAHFLV
jgi:hypothetical protein